MNSWLLGYVSPEGSGGYAVVNGDRELDAVRWFRQTFGYAFRLTQVMPA